MKKSKKERQEAIREIINQYDVTSQTDVWEVLEETYGISVNISTVHRDFKEMGYDDINLDQLYSKTKKVPLREKKKRLFENLASTEATVTYEVKTLFIRSSYDLAPIIALQLEDIFTKYDDYFCSFATPVGKVVVHYSTNIEEDFLKELNDILEGNFTR